MLENPIDFIDQLTPEQEALIPVYIEKWKKIALSTERLDRQKAYDAVVAAYQWFDTEAPEIIFVDSPYEALKELYDYEKQYLQFSLRSDLRHPLVNYDEERRHNSTIIQERTFLERELLQMILQISNLYSVLEDLLDEDDMSIPDEYSEGAYNIDFLTPECCFYDFCISVLHLPYKEKQWQLLKDLVQYCGWIMYYKNICFICERPIKLLFDSENRLHAEGEAAIKFADGFKVYAYQGVILPNKYGEVFTDEWKAQWLVEERNAELRRVLIQGIGYERIYRELGAIELDTWQEYTLLKVDNYVELDDDGSSLQEPMCLLKMVCPSTGHVHMLRVPPDMSSAREAIGWVNWGVEPKDFAVQS
ncbi:hypothetical protein NIES4071_25120 [Calothrix sp. NIES-4071]|nr:hypothetical protein NIES4071_25120 [Calothrix sp. NIES-4071]BAZ56835.1 hypothetical protein NIES4105_25060 [Calothrix sp. NIES-4105]